MLVPATHRAIIPSMQTEICELFGIRYPIIQAGMTRTGFSELAAASANAGILGLVSAGAMSVETFREEIRKTRENAEGRFGVNIPLLREDAERCIEIAHEEDVNIFFTSAGNPAKVESLVRKTGYLRNVIWVHVVANVRMAKKCEALKMDAIVAEGFEAGGHNGYDEITTMCLIPQVVDAVKIPVIAAGGIADARGVLAAFALGAKGVQIGTRFAASVESHLHENYKKAIVEADDTATMLLKRSYNPTRMLLNAYGRKVKELEDKGASRNEIRAICCGIDPMQISAELGDVENGEVEVGQCCGLVRKIQTVKEIVNEIVGEYERIKRCLP